MIRAQINTIITQITYLPTKKEQETYFNLLDQLIENCSDYVVSVVNFSSNVLFGKDTTAVEQQSKEILATLESTLQKINEFCKNRNMPMLSEGTGADFAEALVTEYFNNRSK